MNDKVNITNKRILSIDYGMKRVGLAYTDALHISINYLPFLENNDKFLKKIDFVIKDNNIEFLLVGKPPHIYNNDLFKDSLENFINYLKENYTLNVTTFDESYSTEESFKLISDAKIKKSKRKSSKDSLSAGIILKNFLETMD